MKFSISLEQRNFLNQKGYIPFYELLSASELKTLNDALLSKDLTAHHDLWRENEAIKKIVFSRRLVNLVYELTSKKPIRLGFDHYLPAKKQGLLEEETKSPIEKFFEGTLPLQDQLSINPIIGMFLFLLNEEGEAPTGYFILPGTVFSLDELSLANDQRYFLIGYGDSYSQYLYETRDPEVHFLKPLGYVFGDRLNDNLHPILFR